MGIEYASSLSPNAKILVVIRGGRCDLELVGREWRVEVLDCCTLEDTVDLFCASLTRPSIECNFSKNTIILRNSLN